MTNTNLVILMQCLKFIDLLAIDKGAVSAGNVLDQVDEVFHRPELQGMDGEGLCAGHAPRLM